MKLKNLLVFAICLTITSAVFGQYPEDSLTVTVQGPLLFPGNAPVCDLTGVTSYYMHSGVGNDAAPFSKVTGNWGMDDGVGQMTATGNPDEWSITIHVVDYYGADPASDTAMGVVFRSPDGMAEGKDSACSDIFVRNLNDMQPTVEGSSGNPFPHVTVAWKAAVGINDIPSKIASASVYPNPVVESATIRYSLIENANDVTIKVYNAIGTEVATLVDKQTMNKGTYNTVWDGNDMTGDAVDSGVYFYVIKSGASMLSNRMMVIR